MFPIYLDRKWSQYPWLAHGEDFGENHGTVQKQVRHDKDPSPLKAAPPIGSPSSVMMTTSYI